MLHPKLPVMPRVSKLASQTNDSIYHARGSNPQKKQPCFGPNTLIKLPHGVSSSGDWFLSVAHADDKSAANISVVL